MAPQPFGSLSFAQGLWSPRFYTVYVDGIDRKKAAEMTNGLRLSSISLGLVKRRRDEKEPLIRLADMWAGCIRGALLNKKEESRLFKQAKIEKYLNNVTK